MPFLMIRNDITKVAADAIVNPANRKLLQGSGTSRAIYQAAGEQELTAACEAIGRCDLGRAVCTPAFGLPATYIFHAVCPAWHGGFFGEAKQLAGVYHSALELAAEYHCESVAFPLLSSGNYGYPKEQAFRIAVDTITQYVMEHDLTVYLVLYDQHSLAVSRKLFASVEEYIDDHYVAQNDESYEFDRRRREYFVACPLTFCPPFCGILLPTKAIHHKTEGIVVKKNLTELVFILDRSGSMGGLEQDTIGGFNAMLTRQKEQEGEANVTTILFDHEVQLLHDRFPLHAVAPLTEKDYYVRGCTALLDAIGYGMEKMVNIQRHLPEDERAEKVIFVITTDGLENASKRFSYEKIRRMIEREKEQYGWEFLFLGANMDAVKEAARFGISSDRAVRFENDAQGVAVNYHVVSETVCRMRQADCTASVGADWKEEIEADFKKRHQG